MGDELVILFVDQEELLAPVLAFQNQYQLTSQIVMDPTGGVGQIYNLNFTPTTYFINSEGIIQDILAGVLQLSWLENNLNQSLQ